MLRDLYLVTGAGGTCSSFVSAFIYHWLADIATPMSFEWYASGHNDHEYAWVKNWNDLDWAAPQIFERGSPKDKTLPFVGRQHIPPNTKLLNERFPSHLSFITINDISEIELMGAFLFFKQEVWAYDYNVNLNWNRYNLPIDKHSPHDLTIDEVRQCVDAVQRERVSMDSRYSYLGAISSNTIFLEMYDILCDEDKFLTTISTALEKPITDCIVQSYNKYIDMNKKLITSKCPWITYFNI